MIEFHAPTPADKAWVDELLARGNYRGCDYNFTNPVSYTHLTLPTNSRV